MLKCVLSFSNRELLKMSIDFKYIYSTFNILKKLILEQARITVHYILFLKICQDFDIFEYS